MCQPRRWVGASHVHDSSAISSALLERVSLLALTKGANVSTLFIDTMQ